ncbi:ABC transporter substrate-binding protein [Litorihabitans aurantiacus]|uniref:SsuA/THI5-like domain-containing protein n=1 Tax=Litorihabitans aurantiacus TaxID=1930061 RepID=A0AA37USE8_9MICO|nr:ABC transporter substrate-binding protein [Litorihabitans aurantiacus]GMA31283.1 hypothetical protein GCM10025875_12750 [Litorihabitans aurantiacus]
MTRSTPRTDPATRTSVTRSGALAVAAVLVLTACTGEGDGDTPTDGAAPVTLGLTYVPDIQFAPFYVAEANGYYDEAGLDVELRHHGANEGLFTAVEQGQEDVVVASGDEVLAQRAGGGDLAQIATLYGRSPVALLVPEDSDVTGPADLAGLRIGVAGEFGSTWLGLLEILDAGGLTTDDAVVTSIGFTQTTALLSGEVDAVMGYVNGDAVRLAAAGSPSGRSSRPLS